MKNYTVRAVRWEKGWELHVPGVGVTQSHGLMDAHQMIADSVYVMCGFCATERGICVLDGNSTDPGR